MKQIILQILVLNFKSKRRARGSPGQDISCFVLSTCLLPFVWQVATSWQMTNDNHGYCHALCSYFLWLFWGNWSLGKVKKEKKNIPHSLFPGTSELPIGGADSAAPCIIWGWRSQIGPMSVTPDLITPPVIRGSCYINHSLGQFHLKLGLWISRSIAHRQHG